MTKREVPKMLLFSNIFSNILNQPLKVDYLPNAVGKHLPIPLIDLEENGH